jgi:hypothetical protein
LRRLVLISGAIFCANVVAQGDLPARLALPETAAVFDKIRTTPGFDLSRPAMFGYFFNSPQPDRIRTLQQRLVADGFAFVEMHLDPNGRLWLQVARSEIHSAESLVERNRQLKAVADEIGVQYDGWDIARNAS